MEGFTHEFWHVLTKNHYILIYLVAAKNQSKDLPAKISCFCLQEWGSGTGTSTSWLGLVQD